MLVPLIFVTGISGSGKSTVREELARRGFTAYDTDEDEIAQWQNKITGEITPIFANAHRTSEFMAQNDWRAEPERVQQLADEAAGRTIFLCGTVGNEDEVWHFFDKVFLLAIDEATLRHRLANRTAHDFGREPHELELLLVWHAAIDDLYLGRDTILVDATQPPAIVVDEILRRGAVSG